MKCRYIVGALVALAPWMGVRADLLTLGPVSVPSSPINWTVSGLTLPQFNPALGTLTAVTLSLSGSFNNGAARVENLNPLSDSWINANVNVLVNLYKFAESSAAVWVSPAAIAGSFHASTYDGVTDYGGTSGKTWSGLAASASSAWSSSLAPDLAMFTGTGTVPLKAEAIGFITASISGGNADLKFTSNGSADASVTYEFIPIPEPETYAALAGLGLLGFAGWRRFASRRA
ncbi:MAG: choice-of-anchor E domain-containing protein [Verrucomicrobia bacterium]|nr:choice-of-anchor E domain-containing protein [Verrucomicrobiota bacterium]